MRLMMYDIESAMMMPTIIVCIMRNLLLIPYIYNVGVLSQDLIHNAGDGVDHGVGTSRVFCRIGIDDCFQSQWLDADVDVCSHLDGVSVKVYGSGMLAANADAACLERFDVGVVAQCLGKEVCDNGGCLDNVEGLHDNDIHEAVLH